MWRQRSKALWLKEGDMNTKFLHRRASHRHKKNYIMEVNDSNGRWQVKEARDQVILQYFNDMFAGSTINGDSEFLS